MKSKGAQHLHSEVQSLPLSTPLLSGWCSIVAQTKTPQSTWRWKWSKTVVPLNLLLTFVCISSHLGLVIDVIDLLNHKSEVIIPRQRFVYQAKVCKSRNVKGYKTTERLVFRKKCSHIQPKLVGWSWTLEVLNVMNSFTFPQMSKVSRKKKWASDIFSCWKWQHSNKQKITFPILFPLFIFLFSFEPFI